MRVVGGVIPVKQGGIEEIKTIGWSFTMAKW